MVDTIYVVPPDGAACDHASRRAELLARSLGGERGRIVPVMEAAPGSRGHEPGGEGGGPVAGAAAALTVVGWQARRWWPALHNARLARGILRASRQAVLLVRGDPLQPYRNALFPTDFSAHSLEVLRLAMQVLPPMPFTLLHAYACGGKAPCEPQASRTRRSMPAGAVCSRRRAGPVRALSDRRGPAAAGSRYGWLPPPCSARSPRMGAWRGRTCWSWATGPEHGGTRGAASPTCVPPWIASPAIRS